MKAVNPLLYALGSHFFQILYACSWQKLGFLVQILAQWRTAVP